MFYAFSQPFSHTQLGQSKDINNIYYTMNHWNVNNLQSTKEEELTSSLQMSLHASFWSNTYKVHSLFVLNIEVSRVDCGRSHSLLCDVSFTEMRLPMEPPPWSKMTGKADQTTPLRGRQLWIMVTSITHTEVELTDWRPLFWLTQTVMAAAEKKSVCINKPGRKKKPHSVCTASSLPMIFLPPAAVRCSSACCTFSTAAGHLTANNTIQFYKADEKFTYSSLNFWSMA